MAKALGIGVRVYVEWVPPEELIQCLSNPCCQVGTIIAGPWPPDARFTYRGMRCHNALKDTVWEVLVNGQGYFATESVLTPIDDDNDETEACHGVAARRSREAKAHG